MGGSGGASGHAFISYVREDSAHVDRLQQILQDAGIPVWRDTGELRPGQDWSALIRDAISDNTLVCLPGHRTGLGATPSDQADATLGAASERQLDARLAPREVSLEARASGHAQIFQAGGDLRIDGSA